MSEARVVDVGAWDAARLQELPRQTHTSARTLSCCRRQPSKVGADDLLSSLTNRTTFPSLEEVVFSNVILREEQIDLLSATISSRTLDCLWKKVVLNRCGLDRRGSLKVMQAFVGHPIIEVINLAGNGGTDGMVDSAVHAITAPENRISELNLSANNLSHHALRKLTEAIHLSTTKLHTLSLSNNPTLCSASELQHAKVFNGNEMVIKPDPKMSVERLFSTFLLPSISLKSLSLAGCSMSDAKWARFLPFISCLERLDLSHNLLDDTALLFLSIALEHNTCLVDLDLSYNRFLGVKCTVLEQLLAHNASLHYFSLAGNRFSSEFVWMGISQGLGSNKALLVLDLSDCAIFTPTLMELGNAFKTNDTASLRLTMNPIPSAAVSDPRAFFTHLNPNEYLPLALDPELRCMERALGWRATESKLVNNSIQSQAAATGIADSAAAQDKHAYYLGLVENSSYYFSERELDKVLQDAEQAHSASSIVVDVVLGRWGGVDIGCVKIHALTTYDTVRSNIVPLLENYAKSAGPEAVREYQEFDLIDLTGKKVSAYDAKRRKVWSEIWDQANPSIVVRPTSWLSLGDSSDDNEHEEDAEQERQLR